MRNARHLSPNRIARELGEALSRRLVNACIRDLQRMGGEALLSGEFSGLRNVWDEIAPVGSPPAGRSRNAGTDQPAPPLGR